MGQFSQLDFDFQYMMNTAKAWPFDPLGAILSWISAAGSVAIYTYHIVCIYTVLLYIARISTEHELHWRRVLMAERSGILYRRVLWRSSRLAGRNIHTDIEGMENFFIYSPSTIRQTPACSQESGYFVEWVPVGQRPSYKIIRNLYSTEPICTERHLLSNPTKSTS